MKSAKHVLSIPRGELLHGLVGVLLIAAGLLATAQPARASFEGVDLGRDYDIVYEASDAEVRAVTGVRLVGVVKIGSQEFLAISRQPSSRVDAVKGYLNVDSIRSILPEDTFE